MKSTNCHFQWISHNQIYSFVSVFFPWPRSCLNLNVFCAEFIKDLFSPPRLWSFSTSMIVIFFHLYDCDHFPPPRLGYFSTSTIVLVTNHWSVEHSDKITSTPVSPPVHAATATHLCCLHILCLTRPSGVEDPYPQSGKCSAPLWCFQGQHAHCNLQGESKESDGYQYP